MHDDSTSTPEGGKRDFNKDNPFEDGEQGFNQGNRFSNPELAGKNKKTLFGKELPSWTWAILLYALGFLAVAGFGMVAHFLLAILK